MSTINLLTIDMTPDNIARIEDEAISHFKSRSKTPGAAFDTDHWLLQYLPLVGEDDAEAAYDQIADKLYDSGSLILQMLQCYRRTYRIFSLEAVKAALLSMQGIENPEGFDAKQMLICMEEHNLRRANSSKENDFLDAFVAYCKAYHAPGAASYFDLDGLDAYYMPVKQKADAVEQNSVQISENLLSAQDDREQEIFANFYAKIQQNLNDHPMDIGVDVPWSDLSLQTYSVKVKHYTTRTEQQKQQRRDVRSNRQLRLSRIESQNNRQFNILVWIFLVVAIAAKAVLSFVEPLTEFSFATLPAIDILYGLAIGWIGKITVRTRGRCIIQAWIEAGCALAIVTVAALMNDALMVLLVQGFACWVPMVAAIIMRGKQSR